MVTQSMTFNELKTSLEEHGRRHSWYFHYTTLSVLEKILKNNQLWLSSLENMNDGFEAKAKGADRTFAASFSYGREESVAMWNTYGIPRREAVRICFDGILFRQWLTQMPEGGHFWAIDKNEHTIEELPPNVVDIRLQDIAYSSLRNGNVIYRNELIAAVNDKGMPIKSTSKALYSFVKMGGWSYEKEVRLVIRIANSYKVPDLTYVAVDFGPVIECLRRKKKIRDEYPVTLSPWASSGKMKSMELLVRESVFTGYLDKLKTICDKCDGTIKSCCKCLHKDAR